APLTVWSSAIVARPRQKARRAISRPCFPVPLEGWTRWAKLMLLDRPHAVRAFDFHICKCRGVQVRSASLARAAPGNGAADEPPRRRTLRGAAVLLLINSLYRRAVLSPGPLLPASRGATPGRPPVRSH